MKKWMFGLLCIAAFEAQGFEYELQFENEWICVAKVKMLAGEEIGLHRDVYPQVVIASKGGTVTRLEADGSETEVCFPTGEAVFRKADPESELHRTANRSSEPIELLLIQIKK